MNVWWQFLAAGIGGGGLAGVATALVAGLLQRPKVRADAVAMLTESALKQVNELQERTAEAEREATAARNDLTQARQQIRLLTNEIDAALTTMRTWRSAILADPGTPERLKQMVSANGHHTTLT